MFRTVKDIADASLCVGCGGCAYICPQNKISLVDVVTEGIRPTVQDEQCGECAECVRVCPVCSNDHRNLLEIPRIIESTRAAYGPVLEIWEGYAADPEIRHKGSSGGLLTALSLYCLEREGMHGVLHIAAQRTNALRNETRLSRTRAELLEATGSRYAPASACDKLGLIERSPAPCVFIGQPSEVTALRNAEKLREELHRNVGLRLSFFCAGAPATLGTVELLRTQGITPEDVAEIRYRGQGWPGSFAVRRHDQSMLTSVMSYHDSWGFLQRFRPFSVHLIADGSGEDADISCGDPWHRDVAAGEDGISLILVRTVRGRELLHRARDAGYVHIVPGDASKALRSQVNLIRKRGAIWGRILALRLLGEPAPRLAGYSLLENWIRLSVGDKARSVIGTVRRVHSRRRHRRQPDNAKNRGAAA